MWESKSPGQRPLQDTNKLLMKKILNLFVWIFCLGSYFLVWTFNCLLKELYDYIMLYYYINLQFFIIFTGTAPPSCCPSPSTECDDCSKCFTEEQRCNIAYKDYCDDGSVMKNCQCLVNGTIYKHDEEFEVGDCTECVCKNGELKCEKVCLANFLWAVEKWSSSSKRYIGWLQKKVSFETFRIILTAQRKKQFLQCKAKTELLSLSKENHYLVIVKIIEIRYSKDYIS